MDSILDSIGRIPFVRLKTVSVDTACVAEIVAKLKYSTRFCRSKTAWPKPWLRLPSVGLPSPGQTSPQMIVDPTSGNMGIGLAMVAAVKSDALTLTMPESMSAERIQLLREPGANLS